MALDAKRKLQNKMLKWIHRQNYKDRFFLSPHRPYDPRLEDGIIRNASKYLAGRTRRLRRIGINPKCAYNDGTVANFYNDVG